MKKLTSIIVLLLIYSCNNAVNPVNQTFSSAKATTTIATVAEQNKQPTNTATINNKT